MDDLDKNMSLHISRLWVKKATEADQKIPKAFEDSPDRQAYLVSQSPSTIVRRAWARGDRNIYLHVYGGEAELLSRKRGKFKGWCVEINIMPLVRMDR